MSYYFPLTGPDGSSLLAPTNVYVYKNTLLPALTCSVNHPRSFALSGEQSILPTAEQPVSDCALLENSSGDVQILVQCSVIIHEVGLIHYYEKFAKDASERILTGRLIADDADRPDLLTEKTFLDGQIWITRRCGFKVWTTERCYVLTLSIGTPIAKYQQYASLLFDVINSFKLHAKPVWVLAERLHLITRRLPVDFATYLPASWKEVHYHNNTAQEMNLVYIQKLNGEITGMISICCVHAYLVGGIDAMIAKCQNYYNAKGANLSKPELQKTTSIGPFTDAFNGSVDISIGDALSVNNINFYIARKDESWIYLEAYGPSGNKDFRAWAINNRALDILLRKMILL